MLPIKIIQKRLYFFSSSQRKEKIILCVLCVFAVNILGATMDINRLSSDIIGAAIEVHKHLGPGLLESVYEQCLCSELSSRHLSFESQKPLPVLYKGKKLDCGFRLDIIVEGSIILELKTCEKLEPIHTAQLLTYLRLSGLNLGLLLNFYVPVMRDGIVRVVNNFKE
jgi:GxxExxY protein